MNELRDSARLVISAAEPLAADCERLLDTSHPGTLSSRHNRAAAYRDAGRTAEAITLIEKTLADRAGAGHRPPGHESGA